MTDDYDPESPAGVGSPAPDCTRAPLSLGLHAAVW